MSLQLGENWQLFYQASVAANSVAGTSIYTPIPTIVVPGELSSRILTVGANSTQIKPSWRLAFWMNAFTNIPGIGNVEIANFYCPLGASLKVVQRSVDTFNLRITIPKWHTQMMLEIWQYAGPVLIDQQGTIQQTLVRIEEKIDELQIQ